MRIKVCGMRDPENIREIDELSPDCMGFIFYDKSPRYVDAVPSYMPVNCKRVGVFVNPDKRLVIDRCAEYELDAVQLHGSESAQKCLDLKAALDVKIVKALPVSCAEDIARVHEYEGCVDMVLFDTRCSGYGGSGEKFDWTILEAYDGDVPFVVSGGISPSDAADVCRIHHPRMWGVDINSRFETSPGCKDAALVRCFIDEIKKR